MMLPRRRPGRSNRTSVLAAVHPWHEMFLPDLLLVNRWSMSVSNAKSHRPLNVSSAGVEAAGLSALTEGGDTCCICLGDINGSGSERMGVARLRCGHVFHPACICAWWRRSMLRCPVCRAREGSADDEAANGSAVLSNHRSLWVIGRNTTLWTLFYLEFTNMAMQWGLVRGYHLTGKLLPATVCSALWTALLLQTAFPSFRLDVHPLNVVLGMRSTPRFIRIWTSWM